MIILDGQVSRLASRTDRQTWTEGQTDRQGPTDRQTDGLTSIKKKMHLFLFAISGFLAFDILRNNKNTYKLLEKAN